MVEIIAPQPKELPDGELDIWPTLGPQVCDFLEDRMTYGPGPLKGQPYVVRDDFRYIIYRAYEHYPDGFIQRDGSIETDMSGRRRFNKANISLPKGSAKTELMALLCLVELHPDSPVRFNGYDAEAPGGMAPGRSVLSPYIPLLAPTKDQLTDLAYGAVLEIAKIIPDADIFDPTRDRILIKGESESKIIPVAASASRLDGLKPTFQGLDEPLALDTEVPTTEGWSTIGDLSEGDYVYDRWGKAVKVLGKSPVHEGRDTYRITFRNGSSVVTDANHRWKVIEWNNRPRGEQVVTTKQMLEAGLETGYGLRWRLPKGAGFDGVEKQLPIDPYLLGMWLGDGATNAGYIHTHEDDFDEIVEGYEYKLSTGRPEMRRWLPKGLRSDLRKAGLLGEKHISENYLFSSRPQRKQLLAGLIDSDGYVGENGNVTFVQGKWRLAEDVRLLAVSLGYKATINARTDSRSRTGVMWKVQFVPLDPIPTRVARKFLGGSGHLSEWPSIKSIEKVDSVPVQCIKVDNEDSLFVFGRSGYLTHNTHRLFEDRQRQAVETMENNLPKRAIDDPWQLTVTTAGDPSQPSVAKDQYETGIRMAAGKIKDPNTFFYHRGTSDENAKFDTMEHRLIALREASGEEAAKFRDLRSVAQKWDQTGQDLAYLERVWCNRWVQASANAFDVRKFRNLGSPDLVIPKGELVTLGFDGAQTQDSTALVMTEVDTGIQNLVGLWERPKDEAQWTVPVGEVYDVVESIFDEYDVWAMYCDPPYWHEAIARWSEMYEGKIIEWYTKRTEQMYYAIRSYNEAIESGDVGHNANKDLVSHIGNAGKNELNTVDDEGFHKYRLAKIDKDRKFDAAMAAVISWQARLDALKKGAKPSGEVQIPMRVR